MNGINTKLFNIRNNKGNIRLKDYIKKSLHYKFIALFFTTITPILIIIIVEHINLNEAIYQKALIRFTGDSKVVSYELLSSVRQLAHLDYFKTYFTESESSREDDKYELKRRLNGFLVDKKFIAGVTLYSTKNNPILTHGNQTNNYLIYKLKYTGDYIDKFGQFLGTIKVFIDQEAVLTRLKSEYYTLQETDKGTQSSNPLLLMLEDDLTSEISIPYFIVYPYYGADNYVFLSSALILGFLLIYAFIISKIRKDLTSPISRLFNSITLDCSNVKSNQIQLPQIKELFWINKAINTMALTNKLNFNKARVMYKSLTDKIIDDIHFLKSRVSLLKMLAEGEQAESNKAVLQKIDLVIKDINNYTNKYKLISRIDKCFQKPGYMTLSSILSHLKKVQHQSLKSVTIVNNEALSTQEKFIFISKDALILTINNILSNALEANATNILYKINYTLEYLYIDIYNNGIRLDPSQGNDYMLGHSTKKNGTGTGLSSAYKLFTESNNSIFFKPSDEKNYSTCLRLQLNLVENSFPSIYKEISKRFIISEIVIIDYCLIYSNNNFTPNPNLIITYISSKELREYIQISKKFNIFGNQIYITDADQKLSNLNCQSVTVTNNQVVNITIDN